MSFMIIHDRIRFQIKLTNNAVFCLLALSYWVDEEARFGEALRLIRRALDVAE